jgi:hypothetical protein
MARKLASLVGMPRRSRTDADEVQAAFRVVAQATGNARDRAASKAKRSGKLKKKNPAAVALGRLGGAKGGKARAKKLSPERRREIARKAAETRWGVKPD